MRKLGWNFFCGILLLALAEGGSRLLAGSDGRAGTVRAWTVHNMLDLPRSGALLPLAGLSGRRTYLCREEAGPVAYEADAFGFHNPARAWEMGPDLALIGDSFVQGHCVPEREQLASLLAGRGRRVLNLGLRGSGPLSQLGVLQEYALPRRPKRILWFILANDFLFDLRRELGNPVLASYYEGETQRLRERQPEIDALISRLGASRPPPPATAGLIFPTLVATGLFRLLRPEPTRPLEEGRPRDFRLEDLATFAGILARGKQLAEAQGVPVQFVFVPDSWVFTRAEGPVLAGLIAGLQKELSARGMELVDPTPDFLRDRAPLRRFAAMDGYYGHYDSAGFRLLADVVEKNLRGGPVLAAQGQKNLSAAH